MIDHGTFRHRIWLVGVEKNESEVVVWFDGGEHSPWLIRCIKYDDYLRYATRTMVNYYCQIEAIQGLPTTPQTPNPLQH